MTCNHTHHRLGGIDDCPVCNPQPDDNYNPGTDSEFGDPTAFTSPKAPREWVVCGGSVYEPGKEPRGYVEWAKIHVIEKSAFEELTDEFHDLEHECDQLQATISQLKESEAQLKAERDTLAAKLKEFDEYYTFQTLERVEGQLAEAAKERDELKGRNAYLQQNYAEARDNQKILAAQLAEAKAEVERLNKECISRFLHETRMAELEERIEELELKLAIQANTFAGVQMSKPWKFDPRDFADTFAPSNCANQANAKLAEWIASAPVVYGRDDQWSEREILPTESPESHSWQRRTHIARLICIEPIVRDSAESLLRELLTLETGVGCEPEWLMSLANRARKLLEEK